MTAGSKFMRPYHLISRYEGDMTIKILVADDHKIVRSGIISELSKFKEFSIVGEAENGDEALVKTIENQPDVLLLDITMPGMKVIDVMRKIQSMEMPTKILILSAFCDSGIVYGALHVGAKGYLIKDEAPYIIAEAVRAVARGDAWFSPAVSKILADKALERNELSENQLTKREWEILKSLKDGKSNQDIATLYQISKRTVEFHLTNIYKKINVNSRIKAALWVEEHISNEI